MKLAVQVLPISNRLLSSTAISHRLLSLPHFTSPPPPHCDLSPHFTSAVGNEKISFSGTAAADAPSLFVSMKSASKEEKIDCYPKASPLIDDWKLLEVEEVSIMLYRCKTIKQLKQVHLRMLISGLKDDDNCSSYLADKVMLLTPDLISFDYAYKVFMYLSSNPNISSYNILIKCSIGKSDCIAASAYNRMRYQDNISPDKFTFGFLLKSVASSHRLKSRKFKRGKLKCGKTMHGHVTKLGFITDTFVMNSLLEFYFGFVNRRNQLRAVMKVFDEMPKKDIVSWNAMISSLVYRDFMSEALLVFDDMLLLPDHRCKPDETTLINIINACIDKLLIEQGKWLDAYIKENKLVLSLPLGNALIDMFVSCKDLGNAKVVFKSMSRRCIVTWRRMLEGFAYNHFCKEALLLFDTMCCSEEGGLKPNDNIFYCVLAAFDYDESLLGDGKRLFRAIHKMVHGFGVKPSKTDYDILIRILCRAGWVEAAMMLAESLPWKSSFVSSGCEPDAWIWGCVLCACQIHGDEDLLDSWIRKIDDINSKQDRPNFMTSTLRSYTDGILGQRENDLNYAMLMVESLITKLPEQEHVDYLNKYLKDTVETTASIKAYDHKRGYDKSTHVQETHLPLEDDDGVYKVVESLHDQMMISVIDHPCQLGI